MPVGFLKFGQPWCQPANREHEGCAYHQRLLPRSCQFLGGRLYPCQRTTAARQQGTTVIGQAYAGSRAAEKPESQMIFKRTYLLADGRRRHGEPFRSPRKAASAGRGFQNADPVEDVIRRAMSVG